MNYCREISQFSTRPSWTLNMSGTYVILFLSLYWQITNANLDHLLIKKYFEYKLLQLGYVFTCMEKPDRVALTKELLSEHLRLSLFNIEDATFKIENMHSNNNIGFVLDANCKNALRFLKQCEGENLFAGSRHWLVLASNRSAIGIFEKVDLNVNADVTVAVMTARTTPASWTIYDVYNQAFKHGGQLKTTLIGHYAEVDGYKMQVDKGIYLRRRNMTGTHFKSLLVLNYPFEGPLEKYILTDVNTSKDSYNRYSHLVLQRCSEFYNFSMSTITSKSWGYIVKQNEFDGLVGYLQRKEIDFGSCLFYKAERMPFLEYGRRVWTLKNAFVFRNPKRKSSFKLYLRPLSDSVWICAAVSIFSIVMTLKYALKFEYNACRKVKNLVENTWSFLFLFGIGAVCQQGIQGTPRLYCGRMLTITAFLFTILLYQFYSASIVSSLLMKPPSTINSINDLLKSDLKVGCEDVLYNRDFFRRINTISNKLYKAKIVKNDNETNFLTPEDGLRKVRDGGFAYHVDLSSAYPTIEKTFPNEYICELEEVQMLQHQQVYMPFQKHSPFRDMINFCINLMDEIGILRRLHDHWYARRPICFKQAYRAAPVGMDEFYSLLLLLAIGMSLSLTILTIEIITDRASRALDRRDLQVIKPYVN